MDSAERIAQRRVEIPSKYRKLYDRCMAGTASRRDAIKMQCLECWAYVRTETATCDNCACPLYRYRPYRRPSSARIGEMGERQSTNGQNQEVSVQND